METSESSLFTPLYLVELTGLQMLLLKTKTKGFQLSAPLLALRSFPLLQDTVAASTLVVCHLPPFLQANSTCDHQGHLPPLCQFQTLQEHCAPSSPSAVPPNCAGACQTFSEKLLKGRPLSYQNPTPVNLRVRMTTEPAHTKPLECKSLLCKAQCHSLRKGTFIHALWTCLCGHKREMTDLQNAR